MRKSFLAWSFPNCFLALSVILVERFQLPNPNPNPQPWKHWAFWAGVHVALEGVHLPSVKFVPDNLEHWNLESWQPISAHILQNVKICKQHLARNDIIILVNQAAWSIKLIELLFLLCSKWVWLTISGISYTLFQWLIWGQTWKRENKIVSRFLVERQWQKLFSYKCKIWCAGTCYYVYNI